MWIRFLRRRNFRGKNTWTSWGRDSAGQRGRVLHHAQHCSDKTETRKKPIFWKFHLSGQAEWTLSPITGSYPLLWILAKLRNKDH